MMAINEGAVSAVSALTVPGTTKASHLLFLLTENE